MHYGEHAANMKACAAMDNSNAENNPAGASIYITTVIAGLSALLYNQRTSLGGKTKR